MLGATAVAGRFSTDGSWLEAGLFRAALAFSFAAAASPAFYFASTAAFVSASAVSTALLLVFSSNSAKESAPGFSFGEHARSGASSSAHSTGTLKFGLIDC